MAATYDERLAVPAWWWPVGAGLVILLGAEAHAGFGWLAAVLTDVPLTIAVATAIWWVGRTHIRVDADRLLVGKWTLPLADVVDVRALDDVARRHRMGPGADVRARLVTRPWVSTAVELQLDPEGAGATVPYWLVSTRRPDVLAAAVRQAMPLVPGRSRPGMIGGPG